MARKVQRIEVSIVELERGILVRVDDLDAALVLMTKLGLLFERLGEKARSTLLQILVKRFIVDLQGKIIDCELNPPFAFLRDLTHELFTQDSDLRSSTQVFVGALILRKSLWRSFTAHAYRIATDQFTAQLSDNLQDIVNISCKYDFSHPNLLEVEESSTAEKLIAA